MIYGDHQPPFIANGRGDNDVAVHVITDILELLGPLAEAGFAAGSSTPWTSASEEFRIEGFYSFVVSLLSTQGGADLEYSPQAFSVPTMPTW